LSVSLSPIIFTLRGHRSGSSLRPVRLAGCQDTLTAAARATQAFDEGGNGGGGSYRQTRQRSARRLACQVQMCDCPPESGPRILVGSPPGRFLFQGSAVSMGIVKDPYKYRARASVRTTGRRPPAWSSAYQNSPVVTDLVWFWLPSGECRVIVEGGVNRRATVR
jgi:hypothetical protein